MSEMRTESELIDAFENLELAREQFGHREHVRLAWALMRGWPRAIAFRRFASGLKEFARHHDVAGLYHETITFFFLHLIEDRMRAMPLQHEWSQFAARNPDLVNSPGSLLDDCYHPATLRCDLARHHFVLPDRQAAGRVWSVDACARQA